MLDIKKQYIINEKNNKIAVQIDIETYEKIEILLEDYALGKFIEENDKNDILDINNIEDKNIEAILSITIFFFFTLSEFSDLKFIFPILLIQLIDIRRLTTLIKKSFLKFLLFFNTLSPIISIFIF